MLNKLFNKLTFILCLIFAIYIPKSMAQLNKANPAIGNWTMFFGQARCNEKIGIHFEWQFRDYKILNQPEQILLRTGLVYHFNVNFNATLGYASITNFAYDTERFENPSMTENRLWQQFLLKNNIGRFFFEHRYRIEQRWLKPDNAAAFYRDRIRYLIRVNLPINRKTIESKTLFFSVYDEIFMNITSNPFDRNRLYGGIGFQLNKSLNFQLGYLAQTVNVITKSYLQLGCNYNLDFRKKDI